MAAGVVDDVVVVVGIATRLVRASAMCAVCILYHFYNRMRFSLLLFIQSDATVCEISLHSCNRQPEGNVRIVNKRLGSARRDDNTGQAGAVYRVVGKQTMNAPQQ